MGKFTKVLSWLLLCTLLLTGCSSTSNKSSGTTENQKTKVSVDNKAFKDYINDDELTRYIFKWEKDLGKNKNEVKELMGSCGFLWAMDGLFRGNPEMWKMALMKDKNKLTEILMRSAIDGLLKPEQEEMGVIEDYAYYKNKDFEKWINAAKDDMETTAEIGELSVDVMINKLESLSKKYDANGQYTKAMETRIHLNELGFWKMTLQGLDKASKAALFVDLGSWGLEQFYKVAFLSYSQNSRANELRDFLGGGLDTSDRWQNAMLIEGRKALSFYDNSNFEQQYNAILTDYRNKAGEAATTVVSSSPTLAGVLWSKLVWDGAKLGTSVGKGVEASDYLMKALATEGILNSSLKQYQKYRTALMNSGENPDPKLVEKVKLAGLLALRASIQERNFIIKAYETIEASDSKSSIEVLQQKNIETKAFIAKWLSKNPYQDYKVNSGTNKLTPDYFIPTNFKATYHWLTSGKNVESVDKDGINYEVTWKKIGSNKYEKKAVEMFSGEFTERFDVKPDRISWIYGEDAYNESEIYRKQIKKGEPIELMLNDIGTKWTNDYVIETPIYEEVETEHIVEQCQILGPEKIEVMRQQKEAIKVFVSKPNKMTEEQWYVKGLGLVKIVYKSPEGMVTTELIGVSEGD